MTVLATRSDPRGMSLPAPARLFSEFDRIFGDLWGNFAPTTASDNLTTAIMRLDIRETDDCVVVFAEVPGVEADDIEVTLNGDILSLAGEKKMESAEEGTLHYSERAFGRFRRDIQIPVEVDPDHIQAEYHNGVLTVTLQKKPEHRPHRISVKQR